MARPRVPEVDLFDGRKYDFNALNQVSTGVRLGAHYGRNFVGIVWKDDDEIFYEDIYQNGRIVDTIKGRDVQEVVDSANATYDSD